MPLELHPLQIESSSLGIWTPVRTKPRQEKKLAEYCLQTATAYYLPLNRKVHRYQSKTVENLIPMFAGYVFCQLNETLFKQLLRSNAILFKIPLNTEQEHRLIRELHAVQCYERLARQQEVIVKPELIHGTTVQIVKGPFQGLTGIITQRRGKTLVYLNIELLGQSVATEMDIDDLILLDT